MHDRLAKEGVDCNLLTGQERITTPGCEKLSCTVEMANIEQEVDVAVVDEIQLIGDPQRGHAWTRAVLGLPAKELHVCGDWTAVSLLRELAILSGDEFELHLYDRLLLT